MTNINLALDWTPNTIHIGILAALSQGFYKKEGIALNLLDPADDNYATTPAKKVLSGTADIAICPSESIIAYAEGDREDKLIAIFALLDRDASSILCAENIQSAKDLDGRTYGSYNAKYEDNIIRSAIRNDGGQGTIEISSTSDKLSLFDRVCQGNIDATWIFGPWEGTKAKRMGFKGGQLLLSDCAIPYGYSPLLAIPARTKLDQTTLKAFCRATQEGYDYVKNEPGKAAEILTTYCDEELVFLEESIKDIQQYWATSTYGQMEGTKWTAFLEFLRKNCHLRSTLDTKELFTNEYLKQ